MRIKRHSFPKIPAILTIGIITIIFMISVWLLLSKTVERVIEKEANLSAVQWTRYFSDNLSNVEALVKDGQATKNQVNIINTALDLGEVFRFKLFRPDGTVSFVSDEANFKKEKKLQEYINNKAINVFDTGISNISKKDGRQKNNRPDVYSEAYVPLVNQAGERFGVVEVYIDQTELVASLEGGLDWIALFLPLLSAILFLFPTFALLKECSLADSAKAEAERLADFDELTGLYNRRSFSKIAEISFKNYRSVGTLFIDVDDFKLINEEFGHDGGDALLRNIGHILKNSLGENAISARFGGDEFVSCIGDVTAEELTLIANNILSSITKSITHRDKIINGHISIGLSLTNSDEPLSNMMHAADKALYKSKSEGKQTITFFSDELNNEFERQKKLEHLLRKATQNGSGLELFYQPINQPETKKILGFEALLRMKDENGTMILPDEFIPLAERLGLIVEIGKWVLSEATKTAKEWPEHIFVSVNLSTVQFDEGDLPNFIKGLLLELDFPAERIELEITESILIEDDGSTQKQLAEIKKMGVSIAMDDFGTGYSSLGYLWKYEFDKLKIDRSFLLGYEHEPKKMRKIIGSIIDLGHYFGMYVTMEGVESHDHANILKDMGCDQLQGYYFGKPVYLEQAQLMMKGAVSS